VYIKMYFKGLGRVREGQNGHFWSFLVKMVIFEEVVKSVKMIKMSCFDVIFGSKSGFLEVEKRSKIVLVFRSRGLERF
jgi:hypothetical protein